ncbi:MAG: hypothetical protein GF317_21880 [Candidatus Lokiarchaeota archaeon]|nr:hypothetical protein [Candidatus Lokiarchaeota archaeon]MBD3202109.1 hypothetical protein [Candidatus Lokiarchaeota archaeon]
MNKPEFLTKLIEKPKKISNLNYDQVSDIFSKSFQLFKEEDLLLELNKTDEESKILVIGDIHGNLNSLLSFVSLIEREEPEHILFLGDLVDRGEKQFECLILVLVLKILHPERYYILRGNHETLQMNKNYGFYDEFNWKFGSEHGFSELISLYNQLPICAIINTKTLCLHGGIPEKIDILKDLKKLKSIEIDYSDLNEIEKAVFQMMWNDPKEGLENFMNNFRGSGIKYYGEVAFKEFLEYYNLKYLIRAHECFPEGYRWYFNHRLLSIFSSANYRGNFSPNPASYGLIEDDMVFAEVLD